MFPEIHSAQHGLTHWGWVTHICISKLTIIGSDNGLSPSHRQAIIWTNAGILWIGPLRTKFCEILIEIYILSYKKMRLKMLSGKWWQFCLGLNVLILMKQRNKNLMAWHQLIVNILNEIHFNKYAIPYFLFITQRICNSDIHCDVFDYVFCQQQAFLLCLSSIPINTYTHWGVNNSIWFIYGNHTGNRKSQKWSLLFLWIISLFTRAVPMTYKCLGCSVVSNFTC